MGTGWDPGESSSNIGVECPAAGESSSYRGGNIVWADSSPGSCWTRMYGLTFLSVEAGWDGGGSG